MELGANNIESHNKILKGSESVSGNDHGQSSANEKGNSQGQISTNGNGNSECHSSSNLSNNSSEGEKGTGSRRRKRKSNFLPIVLYFYVNSLFIIPSSLEVVIAQW